MDTSRRSWKRRLTIAAIGIGLSGLLVAPAAAQERARDKDLESGKGHPALRSASRAPAEVKESRPTPGRRAGATRAGAHQQAQRRDHPRDRAGPGQHRSGRAGSYDAGHGKRKAKHYDDHRRPGAYHHRSSSGFKIDVRIGGHDRPHYKPRYDDYYKPRYDDHYKPRYTSHAKPRHVHKHDAHTYEYKLRHGWKQIAFDRFYDARETFEWLTRYDKYDPRAWIGLAVAQGRLGYEGKAIYAMRYAVDLDAKSLVRVDLSYGAKSSVRDLLGQLARRGHHADGRLFLIASLRLILGDEHGAYSAISEAVEYGDRSSAARALKRFLAYRLDYGSHGKHGKHGYR